MGRVSDEKLVAYLECLENDEELKEYVPDVKNIVSKVYKKYDLVQVPDMSCGLDLPLISGTRPVEVSDISPGAENDEAVTVGFYFQKYRFTVTVLKDRPYCVGF